MLFQSYRVQSKIQGRLRPGITVTTESVSKRLIDSSGDVIENRSICSINHQHDLDNHQLALTPTMFSFQIPCVNFLFSVRAAGEKFGTQCAAQVAAAATMHAMVSGDTALLNPCALAIGGMFAVLVTDIKTEGKSLSSMEITHEFSAGTRHSELCSGVSSPV